MNDLVGVKMTVRGFVQGVGFRYFIMKYASSLDLSGYVCNRQDGSVFIKAEGNSNAISNLIVAASQGPPRSYVTDKSIIHEAYTGSFSEFSIK
ncbi:MAG: acylphosphatase [Candidatus Kapaibacterium sp.]|jgi:acylphosphatase|nr:acylphosphatase [Candidatus Kapabacteria bacterium]